MRPGLRLRQVVNALNFATPLGLLVAAVARAEVTAGPDGLLLARDLDLPVRTAPAFTIGNVVLLRLDAEGLARRPRLLAHESRHATQYAWCLGPVLLPLYAVAAGWSWLRHRDLATGNVFERHAGLADGGYLVRDR